jgi:hypothetical protein
MEKKTRNSELNTIMMSIHIACGLYKLLHVSKYLHCFELFTIHKLIVHLVLHGLMCAMNSVLKNHMKWQVGNVLIEIMDGFKDFCGMLLVHGTMDAM